MHQCMACLESTSNHFMCKHYMCKKCATLYLLKYKNYKCPMCREEIYINESTLKNMIKYAKSEEKLSPQAENFFNNLINQLHQL